VHTIWQPPHIRHETTHLRHTIDRLHVDDGLFDLVHPVHGLVVAALVLQARSGFNQNGCGDCHDGQSHHQFNQGEAMGFFAHSQAPALVVIRKCCRPVIPAGIAGIQSTGM